MGWRTLYIEDSHKVSLYLNNLKVENGVEQYVVPIADIDTVIFNNYKMYMTVQLLCKLSQNNVCVIVCEKKRADALTSRPNAAGRQKLIVLRSSCIYWRVAALFILLFGIGGYYYLSEEKITSEAVAVDYKLPDGSSVKLMQNSTLSYNKVSWLWGRKLNLLGSAFFDVTPGKTFTVRTEAGDVTVLDRKSVV